MENQKDKIWKKEWDILIIFDACRYDFFERIYRDYLDGYLEKVKSAGSNTEEYFSSIFKGKDFKDTIYISGIPWINSYGYGPLRAEKWFYKVIDAWDQGWDDSLGTVSPFALSEIADKIISTYSDKRFIIHYLQPHEPYLSLKIRKTLSTSDLLKGKGKTISLLFCAIELYLERLCLKPYLYSLILKIISNLGMGKAMFDLFKKVGIATSGPGSMVIMLGKTGLQQAYEENLRVVFEASANLIKKHLHNNKIIITADHGELLGENDEYGHPLPTFQRKMIPQRVRSKNHPALTEVPWFMVKSVHKMHKSSMLGNVD